MDSEYLRSAAAVAVLAERTLSAPAAGSAAPPGAAVARDGLDCAIRFVHAGGLRWRVLCAGEGPALLLLHGTGSALESWLPLVAALGGRYRVVAPDLPGHCGSGPLPAGQGGLDAYAAATAALTRELCPDAALVVGHSAGAAIGARMALEAAYAHLHVLSLNGALRPLSGWTAATFVPMARLLGWDSLVAGLAGFVTSLVAADGRAVRRLLDSTGSRVDPAMVALYERLMRQRSHVAGTLRMLARWDLRTLAPRLHELGGRLHLVAGLADRTVAPADAAWIQERVAGSTLLGLPGLGHLAHEEAPHILAATLTELVRGSTPSGAAGPSRESTR